MASTTTAAQLAAFEALRRIQRLSAAPVPLPPRTSVAAAASPTDTNNAQAAPLSLNAVAKLPAVRSALSTVGAMKLHAAPASNASSGEAGAPAADTADLAAADTKRPRARIGPSGKRARTHAGEGVLAPGASLIGYATGNGMEPLSAVTLTKGGAASGESSRSRSTGPQRQHAPLPAAASALSRAEAAAASVSGAAAAEPAHKRLRASERATAGSNWFDMPAVVMTEELKRELLVRGKGGAVL